MRVSITSHRLEDKPSQAFHVFATAQTMIAHHQTNVDRVRRIAAQYEIDEGAAAVRRDHRIAGAMEDRGPHPPETVEARGPAGFAFLHPFPGERPFAMLRFVVPRHP